MATEEIDKPSSLPPYPQMIVEAIEASDNKNGSNKTTISKYIESKYGELPANHLNLLSHYLHWMKENGELVFWKNNYTIPSPDTPPRRGRGRPPKSKDSLSLETVQPPRPTRPRGRPPKDPNRVSVGTLSPKVGSGIGRPRGRPRKMAQPAGGINRAGGIAVAMTGTGRPRGRPRKVKAAMAAEVRVQN